MAVYLPPLSEIDEYMKPRVENPKKSRLLEMSSSDNGVIVLENREPVWCDETGSYVLNFNGRVSHASVKNFQLVHPMDRTFWTFTIEEYIAEVFGRIGRDRFSLDFSYPPTFISAFAIAITTFESGFFCD